MAQTPTWPLARCIGSHRHPRQRRSVRSVHTRESEHPKQHSQHTRTTAKNNVGQHTETDRRRRLGGGQRCGDGACSKTEHPLLGTKRIAPASTPQQSWSAQISLARTGLRPRGGPVHDAAGSAVQHHLRIVVRHAIGCAHLHVNVGTVTITIPLSTRGPSNQRVRVPCVQCHPTRHRICTHTKYSVTVVVVVVVLVLVVVVVVLVSVYKRAQNKNFSFPNRTAITQIHMGSCLPQHVAYVP